MSDSWVPFTGAKPEKMRLSWLELAKRLAGELNFQIGWKVPSFEHSNTGIARKVTMYENIASTILKFLEPPVKIPPQSLRWQKEVPENCIPVTSSTQFFDALEKAAASEQLVVAEFFAPHCMACKAMHKAMMKTMKNNPDVVFLQVWTFYPQPLRPTAVRRQIGAVLNNGCVFGPF